MRGERFGDSAQRRSLIDRLMGQVAVVVQLELAQCVAQVVLVPDEGAVQEFVAAGLDPALHEGVHAWHPDAGGTICMPASLRIWSKRAGYFASRSRIRYRTAPLAFCQVHDEVAGGLGDPGRGGVCGRAKDPDAAGGMLDDGEDVPAPAGQGDGLDEIAGQEGLGLGVQEVGPGGGAAVRRGVDAFGSQDLPEGGGGHLHAED